MKKLLLGLLLVPGIAIKAAEPIVPVEQPAMPKEEVIALVQPEVSQEIKEAIHEFNIEFLLKNLEGAEQIKELLKKEKEKGTLSEGIREKADKLKMQGYKVDLIFVQIKVLVDAMEETNDKINPVVLAKIASKLFTFGNIFFEIANQEFSFITESIRKFPDYKADHAGYLVLERMSNVVAAIAKDSGPMKEAEKDFKNGLVKINTADLEYLVNCIRSNSMPDKEKDRECFFDTVANAVDRDYNESIDLNNLKEKIERFTAQANQNL